MDTTGILPVARPAVPAVHAHPSGVHGTSCKVTGCGWGCSSTNAATVAEQADLHRHKHIAAHASRVVADRIAGVTTSPEKEIR